MRARSFLFPALVFGAAMLAWAPLGAQVITYESNGLSYQALSRGGVTIMIAPLHAKVHDWVVYQIAITNGSPVAWEVKPEDFRFEREDGSIVPALGAHDVVDTLMKKGSRSDASKLVIAYEDALYGNLRLHSTNGYESRRQDALVATGSNKLKAAATATVSLSPFSLGAMALDIPVAEMMICVQTKERSPSSCSANTVQTKFVTNNNMREVR